MSPIQLKALFLVLKWIIFYYNSVDGYSETVFIAVAKLTKFENLHRDLKFSVL